MTILIGLKANNPPTDRRDEINTQLEIANNAILKYRYTKTPRLDGGLIMLAFSRNIRPYVDRELSLAADARRAKQYAKEFEHLENAHVLGQESTYQHTKVHCLMLAWGLRQGKLGEVWGQLFRIIGAASKTALGLVPSGNTGGSNISPFATRSLSAEHSAIIAKAKRL
ncbi:DUF3703 domain-containing protein [uncultured Zhongshania sp.]|uniref:DUF3703 domain-containing protein n=1 Tax=uncultured Zhongshania sp. TaxID=1642288 RepID=UPI0030D88B5B|tara:strand:+ start:48 stop:551 length:504 start_codon:yes stop_codon:yes gene_type:complete